MPLLDLQKRLAEVGRIRLGKKTPTSDNKTRPTKLSTFRLTSADRDRLQAVAEIYGGTVQPWDNEHEVITTSDVLEISVLPGQNMTQWWELWGKTGPTAKRITCLRRCDGITQTTGDACRCPDDYGDRSQQAALGQACRPTTRLSVMLPRVRGLGQWRLETHSMGAARELEPTAQMLEALTAQSDIPVPARLRLHHRNAILPNGDTANFVVPVIDIDITLDQLREQVEHAEQQQEKKAAGRGHIQLLDDRPTAQQSVRELDQPARTQRRNSTPQLKSANIEPTRTTITPEQPPGKIVTEDKTSLGRKLIDATPTPEPPKHPPTTTTGGGTLDPAAYIAKTCRELGMNDDARHNFINAITNGRANSTKELTNRELPKARAALQQIANGTLEIRWDPSGKYVLATKEN